MKQQPESARLDIFNAFDEATVIILGHHLDDQVETVFFRVLRGTGLKGLNWHAKTPKNKRKILLDHYCI